ncbi:MAG: type IV pilus assembly protein PilM [bacterium]|nr:type IV pilus assembly protein PilM [bacterium]
MLEFLNIHPLAFGLDISDLSVKVAQLKRGKGGFFLSSFGEFQIPVGVIEHGQIKKEKELTEILKGVRTQVQGEKIKTPYVIASLPEEQAFLQIIQLPRMSKEDLESAVRFEAENYVPYSLDTMEIDFEQVVPVVDHLNHADVLLAALPKATVSSYVAVLKEADFIPLALEIESSAVTRALIQQETAPVPILVVDLGATRTSFIVFAGYSLRFTASIAVSSSRFTQSIAEFLHIGFQEAESLKIQYGLEDQTSASGKKVFEALVPPLTDLIEQIKKHINYYESHAGHEHLQRPISTIQKIILCGGGANLKGIAQFLVGELQKEVSIGNPWVNILPTSLKELPPLSFAESLRYTTAFGLALRAAQLYDQSPSPKG